MKELKDIINTLEKKLLVLETLKNAREILCPQCQLILKEVITEIALL